MIVVNLLFGWIYAKKLEEEDPKSPEDAGARQKKREKIYMETGIKSVYIDLYDYDGVTIIEKYIHDIFSPDIIMIED